MDSTLVTSKFQANADYVIEKLKALTGYLAPTGEKAWEALVKYERFLGYKDLLGIVFSVIVFICLLKFFWKKQQAYIKKGEWDDNIWTGVTIVSLALSIILIMFLVFGPHWNRLFCPEIMAAKLLIGK